MRPYRLEVPPQVIADLHHRLDRTRWSTNLVHGSGWSRGVPLDYLQTLAQYWRHEFDWYTAQDAINGWPQFLTRIYDLDIHFLHVRSTREDAIPLILTHGWPSSFLEYSAVIDQLTAPPASSPAFHLVIPSLPGHGLSQSPSGSGWDVNAVARAWVALMSRLGYQRFLAQGGDWGTLVSLRMGEHAPESVAGVHINMCPTFPSGTTDEEAHFDDEDRRRVQRLAEFADTGIAYVKQQATRPHTLSHMITDSPVAQLAWMVEKFKEWSDCVTLPEEALGRDWLLTQVTLYWVTNSGGSSAEFYRENVPTDQQYVATWSGPFSTPQPVAISRYPRDPAQAIESLAVRDFPSLVQWRSHDRGGHFAAAEEPDLFVQDLRDFARLVNRTSP